MEACYTGYTPTLKVYVRNQTSSHAQQNIFLRSAVYVTTHFPLRCQLSNTFIN